MSESGRKPSDLKSTGVGGPVRFAALVGALFFGGAWAWSAWAPIESGVMAPATLVVDTNRKAVQHLEGGTVAELLVREGDRVEAGQIVIRLDRTVPQATLDLLRGQWWASQALAARLAAERDARDEIVFPPELTDQIDDPRVPELISAERRIFEARRAQIESQTRILRQRNAQAAEEIRGLDQEIKAQDRQLTLIAEEADGVRQLVEKGMERKPRLLALQRTTAEIEGARAQNVARIAQVQQSIGEVDLRILDLRASVLSEAVQKLRDERTRIFDVLERLRAAEDTLARTEIRAPVSGRVVGLKVFTVRGVISPREPLMDIVPSEDILVVEAQVPVSEIDAVRVGLPVQLRFSALNQRTTPTVEGEVANVSPDRLVDPRSGQPYYTARILVGDIGRLPPDTLLKAGMPVEAMIRTGERTILEYLAKPLTDFTHRALRER
jgi:HlyD family type I secretion membrane fusion protein